MGDTIQNILVIAETREIGPCLEGILRAQGYLVTTEDSYAPGSAAEGEFDLIIVTNTSLTPDQMRRVVPGIKARSPQTRIIVVSGYFGGEWVSDLKKHGADEILELPIEEETLRTEVAALLSAPV